MTDDEANSILWERLDDFRVDGELLEHALRQRPPADQAAFRRMSRVQIALHGDDAEWFYELKAKVAEKRDGTEPSNPEVVRLMTEQFNP